MLFLYGQITSGALSCWKCQLTCESRCVFLIQTLHKKVGMLFNCSAFLLISVVGMSSKGWRHSCSVPMRPSPVVYMVKQFHLYRHEQLCSNETFLFPFFNCLEYLVFISMDMPGMTISTYTFVIRSFK